MCLTHAAFVLSSLALSPWGSGCEPRPTPSDAAPGPGPEPAVWAPPTGPASQVLTPTPITPLDDVGISFSTHREAFGASWFEVTRTDHQITISAGSRGGATASLDVFDHPEDEDWREEFGALEPLVSIGAPKQCGARIYQAVEIVQDNHAAVESWETELYLLSAPSQAGGGGGRVQGPLEFRGHQHASASGSVDWGGEVLLDHDCHVQVWLVDAEIACEYSGGPANGRWRLTTRSPLGCDFDSDQNQARFDQFWTVHRCEGFPEERPALATPGEWGVRGVEVRGCSVEALLGFYAPWEPEFPAYQPLHEAEVRAGCGWRG